MNVVIRIFFVFICFTFHIGNGLAATKQNALEELPLCKSEWCFVTAKPMLWPALTAQEVLKVNYKQLSLSLPKNIDYIGIADAVTVFSYGKKNILIGSITKDDFTLPESDISLLEGFEITFTGSNPGLLPIPNFAVSLCHMGFKDGFKGSIIDRTADA